MCKILLVDNFDSFTYNLAHYVEGVTSTKVDVIRNDELDLDLINHYDGIILSPGPGLPSESGLLIPLLQRYFATKRIFGVCLGQQAIAQLFGGELENMARVMHGVATPIKQTNTNHNLFKGLPSEFLVGRYHSWVVSKRNFPECLQVDAIDEYGHIMALSHKMLDICAVQFHPESILTPMGKTIIQNWVSGF
jgi:anthranilate synthase component II